MPLPAGPSDGLIVVAKRECPTCTLVEPLLAALAAGGEPLTVYVQDDPAYAAGLRGANGRRAAVSTALACGARGEHCEALVAAAPACGSWDAQCHLPADSCPARVV
jgi:hypothetical protein